MRCPYCGEDETKVVDSRQADEGLSIRRRRECINCQKRFTTYETVETVPIMVVKRDGRRQPYDRNKIINGLVRACEKRPVSAQDMDAIARSVEQTLQNSMVREITTSDIGEMVMDQLKPLDQVAYVRFASVYRQFKDINSFMVELNRLLEER